MTMIEVKKFDSETYSIDCPRCSKTLGLYDLRDMPWDEGSSEVFKCPCCGVDVIVHPVYKFIGFTACCEEVEE